MPDTPATPDTSSNCAAPLVPAPASPAPAISASASSLEINDAMPELADLAWRDKGPAVNLYHSMSSRVVVQHQRSNVPIGVEFSRREQVEEAGVFCAELDSAAFARNLVQALANELSLRDLKLIAQEFSNELEREEAERLLRVPRA